MAKKKAQWIVEIYDPILDIITWQSYPMPEVKAVDLMITLDKQNPTMSVSSREAD